jgi:hypothetical protein
MNIAAERGRAASTNLSLVSLFWYSCCHSCNDKPVCLSVHVIIFYLYISCLLYKCIYFMCNVTKTVTISHAREYSCFFFKTTQIIFSTSLYCSHINTDLVHLDSEKERLKGMARYIRSLPFVLLYS